MNEPLQPPRIELRGVSKTFRNSESELNALSEVHTSFREGEFVTLFGPSGCGKTTLLRLLAGLDTPSSGEISIFGDTPAEASQRKNIAWVPQSPGLLPWLDVRSNALLSDVVNRRADRTETGRRRREDPDKVLEELGLADFARTRPAELSGGMRQRVAIARAFVQGAPLMLMDEPFSALDELTRESIRIRLLKVWEKYRKTVIFVTHSAYEAVMLSDRIIIMTPRPGRIHADVTIDLPHPRTREVLESHAFIEKVREVRNILREGWEQDE